MPLPITVSSVVKRYGSVRALDGVSLDIKAGDFVTLLGPSGSGKTTLLMVMAGFVRPEGGSLLFGDRQVLLLPPHRRNIGMVFQNYALFPHMDVLANVMFPLAARRVPAEEARRRAEAALAMVDLADYGGRATHQLSGGQQQRVALARAIVYEPPILLMDEPLSALDKNLRERMQIEIRHLHRRLGMTIVYVTHDQREALTMSDMVAVLNRGQVEQYAQPEQIYDAPASEFVANFIGETSLVPVALDAGGARLGDRLLKLPRKPAAAASYVLVLRPERLELLTVGKPPPQGMNAIGGVVHDRVFQGESVLFLIALPNGQEFSFRVQSKASLRSQLPEVGAPVEFALEVDDTLVVPRQA
ncbi:MAG: ABC transporter ATP-binding protein [Parvibaculaceae bacterium]